MSGGRAVLGVGAGHTRAEWAMVGQTFPSAPERVTDLCDLVAATTALLEAETVSMQNESFHLDDAGLGEIRPVQDRIPLLVGGNGTRVLSFAARHADFVGITGTRWRSNVRHARVFIPGYTPGVKTAISLPDSTYERVNRRARELGMSRSEFFARAAESFLDELDADSLTKRIDTALTSIDPDDSAADAVGVGRRLLATNDDEW